MPSLPKYYRYWKRSIPWNWNVGGVVAAVVKSLMMGWCDDGEDDYFGCSVSLWMIERVVEDVSVERRSRSSDWIVSESFCE